MFKWHSTYLKGVHRVVDGIRRNCNLLSLESRVSVAIAIAGYVYYSSPYYIDLLSSRSDMIK